MFVEDVYYVNMTKENINIFRKRIIMLIVSFILNTTVFSEMFYSLFKIKNIKTLSFEKISVLKIKIEELIKFL